MINSSEFPKAGYIDIVKITVMQVFRGLDYHIRMYYNDLEH